MIRPPVAKFVRYGPPPRYRMPEAGFCASVFVLVRSGGRILAGIPKDHRKWREQWQPNINVYRPQDQEAEFRSWRLPAAYLLEGEHPDACARRVLADQLRIGAKRLDRPAIYTFYDPSRWYPGHRHYDLCFVYEVEGSAPRALPPWWQRLEFVEFRFLRKEDLGSAMGDLVKVITLRNRRNRVGPSGEPVTTSSAPPEGRGQSN